MVLIFNYYTITAFVNFLASALMAIFIISKNYRNEKNISFAFLAGVLAAWNLCYFVWQNFIWQDIPNGGEIALFWCRALMYFVVLMPVGYVQLALALTEQLKKRWKLLVFLYAITFIFLIINLAGYLVTRVEPVMDFKYWPLSDPITSIYWLYFGTFMTYSSYLLVKGYRAATGSKRLQLKYVTLGCVIAFISGSFNIIPWYKINIPPITHISASFYVILTAYAIIRYRFMDIRIALKNILFYLGASFSLYASFYIISIIYKNLFGSVFNSSAYLMGLALAPIFAIILYSTSRFFSAFINKYIFSSIYHYQQYIKKTSGELSHSTDVNKISEITLNVIKNTLQPDGTAFLLRKTNKNTFEILSQDGFSDKNIHSIDFNFLTDYFKKNERILSRDEIIKNIEDKKIENLSATIYIREQFDKYGISICVPIIINDSLLGLIILGERQNIDSYTQSDFELIETISNQVQTSIDNALLYETLKEKNKNLEVLLSEKDDFIRITTHQLNTPLSIMKNAQTMVESGSLNLKQGMYYFENGLNKISEVLDDFWSASQSENEIRTIAQKINVTNIIKKITKIKKDMLLVEGKKIKILIKKNLKDIPDVYCDPKQINQVFYNLFNNAVAYTLKGSISIDYELVKDNNFLKINVKDTGIGLLKEDLQKLGQKFYRSKKATLSRPDGSGLGIYICKKLVEKNGGKLSFESEGENKGSTFSVLLPIYKNKS
jgi:signal transduction histidine kinase